MSPGAGRVVIDERDPIEGGLDGGSDVTFNEAV